MGQAIMVQQREVDPFDALIAQGVTAMEPDPSAEPTVVEPKAAPLEPRVLFTAPEPEPVLPPPWWRQQPAWLIAGGVVVAAIALSVSSSPEPLVVPAPPPPVAARPPERAPAVAAPAPAPAPKAKRASRPAAATGGFAEWPGVRRQPAPAPKPARGEALKRPSF